MNRDEFLAAVLRNPNNKIIADELLRLALPDAWIVSGCLVQTVWNVQTGRPVDYGIKDYDVFYFDHDCGRKSECCRRYRTTPEINPALRRGGLMSFFRKQCASRPA